jgi:hypothetical protein
MKQKYGLFVILFFILIFVFSDGYAQQGRGNPKDPRARERVEQLRKMKLIETLNLDEEKSARFISRLTKHQEAVRTLMNERSTAVDGLEQAIKDSREGEYPHLIDGMLVIDRKIFDERVKFIQSLSDLLTKKQQAQYLVFDRNFNRDLRDMIFDVRRGPGPGPGPGSGPEPEH